MGLSGAKGSVLDATRLHPVRRLHHLRSTHSVAPVKVLVVTNDFPPRIGGINYYVDQIFRRFEPGTVEVVAPRAPDTEAFDRDWPHPVHRWRRRALLPGPAFHRYLKGIAAAFQPDIVLFGAMVPFGLSGLALRQVTGVPIGGFTHGVEVSVSRVRVLRPVMRLAGQRTALLTAVSGWTLDTLKRDFGDTPTWGLLPAGIDADQFRPDLDAEELRDRYGLGDDPVISCVSRLVERKGQDALIRVLPSVRERVPGTRLLIVGSGRFEEPLRNMVAERNLGDAVVFTGSVPYDELAAHFRVGDVFATPCRHRKFGLEVEALGAVFLQASAVARPAIGGDVGGVSDAIRHGETGLLVDPHSDDAIAAALIELLSDPDRARRMGAAGAKWVHHDLTWDAIAQSLKDLLDKALKAST